MKKFFILINLFLLSCSAPDKVEPVPVVKTCKMTAYYQTRTETTVNSVIDASRSTPWVDAGGSYYYGTNCNDDLLSVKLKSINILYSPDAPNNTITITTKYERYQVRGE